MEIRVVEEFLRFSGNSGDGAVEIRGSFVWSARVDAWVAIVAGY